MRTLILGLGVSGQAACRLLKSRGHQVVGVDDRTAPLQEVDLREFDLFVPSPGVSRSHPLYRKAVELGISIAGEAQLALEGLKQPSIGVTGTNGKTTVVKLIEHCLNLSGKRAKAVGNVGLPISDQVGIDREEILVVELSSFQLETLKTPSLDIALVLNIAEDHLNRYDSFQEYAKVKAGIESCVKEGGRCFVDDSISPSLFKKGPTFFGEGAFGRGNHQAAYLACVEMGLTDLQFKRGLHSFIRPEHRMEFVAEMGEVRYYNDSKATNIDSVLFAMKQMDRPVMLLAGGLDKNLSFEPLRSVAHQLAFVATFGQTREKIAEVLRGLVEVASFETLQEAIDAARKRAEPGSSVLLSPGCASLDAFKSYEERGRMFKRYILEGNWG